MYLWCCRFGNKEFSVELQLLRPRLIGHWNFLCLSKGPLCRLNRYKLWPTERKNKAHWGRSSVPDWLLSCSLLSTGSRGGMKSRNKSSHIYKKKFTPHCTSCAVTLCSALFYEMTKQIAAFRVSFHKKEMCSNMAYLISWNSKYLFSGNTTMQKILSRLSDI